MVKVAIGAQWLMIAVGVSLSLVLWRFSPGSSAGYA